MEAFEFGGDDGCAGRRVAEQDVVETGPGWVFGHANTGGGIALWVRVDDENPEIVGGQSGSEVDGGGGLPYPALLVDDRKDSAQAVILAWLVFHVKHELKCLFGMGSFSSWLACVRSLNSGGGQNLG